jgi:hypothetical protein
MRRQNQAKFKNGVNMITLPYVGDGRGKLFYSTGVTSGLTLARVFKFLLFLENSIPKQVNTAVGQTFLC